MPPKGKPGRSIKLIVAINTLAAILTIAFWSLVFIKLKSPLAFTGVAERANMATTYAFGIADLIWSAPFLVISAAGLWRLTPWGWTLAQMTNALWWYSMTVIISKDIYAGCLSPGTIIFFPFALFALWAARQLWKQRNAFLNEKG